MNNITGRVSGLKNILGLAVLLAILVFFGPVGSIAQQAAGSQPAVASEGQDSPGDFFSQIFASGSHEGLPVTLGKVTLRLALAAVLAALLAFRPRRKAVVTPGPHVAQTQILLAIVAAALMMIVSDNAARAFGIFAAASLVRFRTNIQDPKETTVLLVSLGIGLAAGVGRWDLALVVAGFVMITLWLLELREPRHLYRSMDLTIKTHNVDRTERALKRLFEKSGVAAEVKGVNREDEEDPLGKITYSVNLNSSISTDRVSEEIFASDAHDVDSVQWRHKKDHLER